MSGLTRQSGLARRPWPGRRRLGGLVALSLVLTGLVATFTGPSASAVTPVSGGTYTLANGSSGKCLEVPGTSTANGTLLTQASCVAGATRQQWKLTASGANYSFTNVGSGKCIDLPSGSTVSGTQFQQYSCGTPNNNRLFGLTASAAAAGKYRIVNVASALCISNKDGSTAGNDPIVQEACSDIARMQWLFNSVSGTTTPTTTTTTSSGRTWSNTADGFAAGTTGGAAGTTVTVSTYADLLKYATASAAYTIKIPGTITVPTMGYEIPVTSNKTLIGAGKNGRIKNGGIFLAAGVKNVIIRNLTIGDTAMTDDDPDDKVYDYDGIQMDTASYVWIDHVKFQNINDGMIDSRKDTTNVTVSWSILGNHNKAFGIGWTTNVTARETIHHNWIHDTNQRNPSADNLQYAHLYNNYLVNVASYGNYARGATKMVLENSYFQNVKDAWTYDAANGAQLRQSGSTCVSCTGTQTTSGSAFTPSSFYSYTLDATANVPTLVKTYAGPQANIGL